MVCQNLKANFGPTDPTDQRKPSQEMVLNILVRLNQNGHFHLTFEQNLPIFGHNGRHPESL